jgi:SAM-dependent methyltransferase
MTEAIHPVAATGFGTAADVYERGRPSYPQEIVDHVVRTLAVGPGRTVLDLGAGTGKLTRLLEPTGAAIVAVEPVDAMRAELARRCPNACALAGTAESIPLKDATVDAVVAAQAFHWFDGERALSEIHRVLRPEGRLCLLWNVRDGSVDWVARLTEIIDVHRGDAPRYRASEWRRSFERTGLFGPIHGWVAVHVHEMEPEAVLDRVASISFIAALDDERRADVCDRVRELIRTHPDLAGRERIPFPYRTDVYWCERRVA